MARKKQEIALQVEIETQEEWEEMLAKEGLTVVDIYQEWAGPCKAMIANFRRLKNELGDDLLRFSIAKSDTVDSLERYRGRCEPCFLFFAGGVLVSQIRGANAPLLLRVITEQLAHEHKVLDGSAERKEIKDPLLIDVDTGKDEDEEDEEEGGEDLEQDVGKKDNVDDSKLSDGLRYNGENIIFESLPQLADEDDEETQERKKDVTVAIIKPNVVADGKVEELIEQMKESGVEILEQQEKTFTDEEAREFYSHKQEEEYFEDLINFMTSGPSHILVLSKGTTGEGIIEEWRELLGPASVEDAKEEAPESLRAKFGGDKNYVNALHGSDSQETATRELAFFFPDYAQPTVEIKTKKPKVQRTLALIRPDALKDHKDEILAKIEEAGFKVALQKEIQLTLEQAEDFYKEHKGEEYFEKLTVCMSSGPLLALGLAREDAISGWREILGPKEVENIKEEAPESLRAQFLAEDVPVNQIHGSDSVETAKQELEYFFPMQQTVAVIKPDAYQTKDEIMQRIRESGFHIAARKETELTKDISEQLYKDHTDKDYFNDLTDHMSSGPTLFMVLSREDAVDGWRSLIGPTDPEKAKEEAPDTIRAQYGTDIKSNAIHGSSNVDHARESMKLVFGDLEFEADGTVVQGSAEPKEEQETEQQDEEGDDEKKEQDQDQTSQQGEEQQEEDGEKKEEDKDEDKKDDDDEKKEGDEEEGEKKEEDGDKKSEAGDEKKDEDETKAGSRSQSPEQKDEDDKKEGSRKGSAKGSRKGSAEGSRKGSPDHKEDDKKEDSRQGTPTQKEDDDKKEDASSQKGDDKDDKKDDGHKSDDEKDDKKQKDDDEKQDDTKSQKHEDDTKEDDDKKEDGEKKEDDQKSVKDDDEQKEDDGQKEEETNEDKVTKDADAESVKDGRKSVREEDEEKGAEEEETSKDDKKDDDTKSQGSLKEEDAAKDDDAAKEDDAAKQEDTTKEEDDTKEDTKDEENTKDEAQDDGNKDEDTKGDDKTDDVKEDDTKADDTETKGDQSEEPKEDSEDKKDEDGEKKGDDDDAKKDDDDAKKDDDDAKKDDDDAKEDDDAKKDDDDAKKDGGED